MLLECFQEKLCMCIVQLRDHAVSFFQHLCHQMRSAYVKSKPMAIATRDPPPAKVSVKQPSVAKATSTTRSNSKKRKLVGSGSSLSDPEGLSPVPIDQKSNVTFFAGADLSPAEERRLSYSSSSSSSGCSSTVTVCDLEADDDESTAVVATDNANVVVAAEAADSFLRSDFNSPNVWACPNVSLPPAPGRSITRVSSVGSGRGGSIDESSLECVPATAFASVLVVSHGGLIAELIGHFAEELGCNLPGGRSAAQQITPNAGLSRFSITLLPPVDEDELEDPEAWIQSRIECLSLHDKDHLANDLEAIPLASREAF
jgi:hypothetical protein